MLKLNFIIRLNGTIANTIRLCHNPGVEEISCYLLRCRWLDQCTLNSLFAPVVTRREICCQCSFAGAIRVWGHLGLLVGWIANLQKLSSIFSPGLPLWWRVGERLSNFGWGALLWALTYDYAVRTLQFSRVSHNTVDVPVLDWLSNDELGDYVALKLSV